MITEFLTYKKKVQNLSDGSLKEYGKNLRTFAMWMNTYLPGKTWRTVTRQDIEQHMQAMHEAKMAPRTIRLRIAAIRSLYNYMIVQGMIKSSPAKYITMPKTGMQLPKTVSVEALTKYVTSPAKTGETVEIQALTALLIETGIRIQEALDIKPADIDHKEMSITITGKGNKQRKVYYGDMTKQKMNALCAVIDWKHGFFTRDQWTYRKMMSDELRPYVQYIHPHMLRHTYATTLLQNGTPLKYVSELLGHESVTTTERYTHAVDNAVKAAAQNKAPRLFE